MTHGRTAVTPPYATDPAARNPGRRPSIKRTVITPMRLDLIGYGCEPGGSDLNEIDGPKPLVRVRKGP